MIRAQHDYSGANFTAYQELKKFAHQHQPELVDLPSYQHMIIGLISGAMGPFSNAPIDTIKTRTLSFICHSWSDVVSLCSNGNDTQGCKRHHSLRVCQRSHASRRSRPICGARRVCTLSTRV